MATPKQKSNALFDFLANPDDTKDLEKRRLKKITASKSQQINCNQDTVILGIKIEKQKIKEKQHQIMKYLYSR